MEEEIAEVFFLGPWKNELCTGVQFTGGDHGSQSVEIGIDMGGNNFFRLFHGATLKFWCEQGERSDGSIRTTASTSFDIKGLSGIKRKAGHARMTPAGFHNK